MTDPQPPPIVPGKDYRTNWWKDFYDGFIAAVVSPETHSWFGDVAETVFARGFSVFFALWFKFQSNLLILAQGAMEEVLGKAGQQIANMTAVGLSAFFGTDVPAGSVNPRGGLSGHSELAEHLGALVLNAMFGDLETSSAPSPAAGIANAEKLVGVGVNLGITGMIEHLGLPPIVHELLPEIGSLKETVAHNLGMGRLTRRGLAPLLAARIVNPLTRHLNELYRPTLLTEVQAAREAIRDDSKEALFDATMAARGYTSDLAAGLLYQTAKNPGVGELERLLVNREIDGDAVIKALRTDGYHEGSAATLLRMMQNARVHTYMLEVATLARQMYAAREITRDELDQLADQAGLSEKEKAALVGLAELERGKPRRLSLAEMEAFYLDDTVTIDQLRTFLEQEGFSEQDVAWIQASAVKKKAVEAGKAQLRGPLPAPGAGRPLSVLQVTEAYRRTLITDQQLTAHLVALGFTGEALAALQATALLKRQAFIEAQTKHKPPPKGATLPKSTAHEAYVRGLETRDELRAFLDGQGYTADAVDILLEIADQDRKAYELRLQKAAGKAAAPKKAPAATPAAPGA